MSTPQDEMQQWNPRFAAFAAAHGKRPQDCQPPHHEFICWIRGKWREFKAAHGIRSVHVGEKEHADFDAWLQTIGGSR